MGFRQVIEANKLAMRIADIEQDIYNTDSETRLATIQRNEESLVYGDFNKVLNEIDSLMVHSTSDGYKLEKLKESINSYSEQYKLLGRIQEKKATVNYIYESGYNDLAVVNQSIYNSAVINGFPQGFFKNKYFEKVDFYCFPQKADFSNSYLQNCTFNLCSAPQASFSHTTLSCCSFSSMWLENANFENANFEHTNFRHCDLNKNIFTNAHFNGGYICECDLNKANFMEVKIDGTWFASITGKIQSGCVAIENFTMGGATKEEVQRYAEKQLQNLCNGSISIAARLQKASFTADNKNTNCPARKAKAVPEL